MRSKLSLIVGLSCAFVASNAAAQNYGQPNSAQPNNQPYGAQQPPPGNGGFQSGGLAPPPTMNGDPNQPQPGYQTETERQLTEAEKEDAGRGLEWIYFNVEGGYEYLGLQTFKSDGLTYADTVGTSAGGPMIGAGAGIRLIFITLGGRARLGMFDQWNVATINAELGIHIPIGDVEPYFTFGGGYAFLGAMDAGNWGGDASIRGWDARAGFGLDYYVTPTFSIGGNLTGEALFLSRPGVDLSAAATGSGSTGQDPQLDAASQKVAEADGSSIGAAFTGSAVLGLHF
jgi:hypothetical protein